MGTALLPVPPARAQQGVFTIAPVTVHDPTPASPASGDEEHYLNAAAWAGTVTVSGSIAAPGAGARVRVALAQAQETCPGESGAMSSVVERPVGTDGSFSASFPPSARTALREGMRVCAVVWTSSDGGTTYGSPVGGTIRPRIDLSVVAGGIRADAYGPSVDVDPGPGVTSADFLNAAERLAPDGLKLVTDPVGDGDPDGDPGTHTDLASVTVRVAVPAGAPAACTAGVPHVGRSATTALPPACLEALPDGPFVAEAVWRDRAGNFAVSRSSDPVVVDTTLPATPNLQLPPVVTSNDAFAVPAKVGGAEANSTVRVSVWRGQRAAGHPEGVKLWASSGTVTVPVDVRALADCAPGVACVEATATVTDLAGNESRESPRVHAAKDVVPAALLSVEPRLARVTVEPDGDRRVDLDDAASLALLLRNDAPDAEPVTWRVKVDDLTTPWTPPTGTFGSLEVGAEAFVLVPVHGFVNGEIDVTVEVLDSVGNVATVPLREQGLRFMRTAGPVRVAAPAAAAVVGSRFEVRGFAPTGSSVRLALDGAVLATVVAKDGTFRAEVEAPGSGTDRVLTATAGDERAAMRITVDGERPRAPSVEGARVAGLHLAFDGRLTGSLAGLDDDGIGNPDATGVVAHEIDGLGFVRILPARVEGGRWFIDLFPGAPGSRVVSIRAVDEAGGFGQATDIRVLALHPAAPVPDPLPDPPYGVPDPRPTPPSSCTGFSDVPDCFAGLTGRPAPNPERCIAGDTAGCADGLIGRPHPPLPSP